MKKFDFKVQKMFLLGHMPTLIEDVAPHAIPSLQIYNQLIIVIPIHFFGFTRKLYFCSAFYFCRSVQSTFFLPRRRAKKVQPEWILFLPFPFRTIVRHNHDRLAETKKKAHFVVGDTKSRTLSQIQSTMGLQFISFPKSMNYSAVKKMDQKMSSYFIHI